MEKLLEKLGLKADATEEEALAKVQERDDKIKTLESENSSLKDSNKELTTAVEGKTADLEKIKSEYIKRFEQQEEKKENKTLDLFEELAQN